MEWVHVNGVPLYADEWVKLDLFHIKGTASFDVELINLVCSKSSERLCLMLIE